MLPLVGVHFNDPLQEKFGDAKWIIEESQYNDQKKNDRQNRSQQNTNGH